jgi:hypothetical protein
LKFRDLTRVDIEGAGFILEDPGQLAAQVLDEAVISIACAETD